MAWYVFHLLTVYSTFTWSVNWYSSPVPGWFLLVRVLFCSFSSISFTWPLFECHLCLFYFVCVSARIPGGYFIPLFDFQMFCHSTYFLWFCSLPGRILLTFYEHFLLLPLFWLYFAHVFCSLSEHLFSYFRSQVAVASGPFRALTCPLAHFFPTTLLCETCLHTVPLDFQTPSSPSSRSTLPFSFRDLSGFLPWPHLVHDLLPCHLFFAPTYPYFGCLDLKGRYC